MFTVTTFKRDTYQPSNHSRWEVLVVASTEYMLLGYWNNKTPMVRMWVGELQK